ncbi:MAG TPA: hypothetical protein VIK91_20430 [Nannocystis sp.]
MKFRIDHHTWIYTSIFALAVAFAVGACDDPDAVSEESFTVESPDEQAYDRAAVEEFVLSDEAEEAPETALEERRRRGRDDDDHHRRVRRDDDHHRHGRRDDDHHRRARRDDDHHRHGRRDDDHHRHGRHGRHGHRY